MLHPDFLKALLTPRQFGGWIRFFNVEPWGFPVDEERFLRLSSLLAEIDRKQWTLVPPKPEPEQAPAPAHVANDEMLNAIAKAFFRAEQTTPLKPGVHATGESPKP